MDDKATNPTTEELVQRGVELFAKAELGLNDAMEAMLSMRKIFALAYANNAVQGADAIRLKSEAVELAAFIGTLKGQVLSFHEKCTEFAQSANVDIAEPYAELPPRQTRSSGR